MPQGDETEISAEDDAAANQLIDELLKEGFTYDDVGRAQHLAGRVGDDDGNADNGGDGSDDEPVAGGVPADGADAGDGSADGAADGADAGDGSAGDGGTGGGDGLGADGGDDDGAAAAGTATADPIEAELHALKPAEKAGLLHIRQLILEHPELGGHFQEMVTNVMAGRKPTEGVKPAEPAALPDFIDPDDPAAVATWREVEKLRADYDGLKREKEQDTARASAHRVASDIAAGVQKFRDAHPELSDTDINSVRDWTQVNVNVAGVIGTGDPVEGIAKALEIGSMTDPAVRDKVAGTATSATGTQNGKDQRRKRNLGALSGSSGSSRRTPAAPKQPSNWNEAAAALAEEFEKLT